MQSDILESSCISDRSNKSTCKTWDPRENGVSQIIPAEVSLSKVSLDLDDITGDNGNNDNNGNNGNNGNTSCNHVTNSILPVWDGLDLSRDGLDLSHDLDILIQRLKQMNSISSEPSIVIEDDTSYSNLSSLSNHNGNHNSNHNGNHGNHNGNHGNHSMGDNLVLQFSKIRSISGEWVGSPDTSTISPQGISTLSPQGVSILQSVSDQTNPGNHGNLSSNYGNSSQLNPGLNIIRPVSPNPLSPRRLQQAIEDSIIDAEKAQLTKDAEKLPFAQPLIDAEISVVTKEVLPKEEMEIPLEVANDITREDTTTETEEVSSKDHIQTFLALNPEYLQMLKPVAKPPAHPAAAQLAQPVKPPKPARMKPASKQLLKEEPAFMKPIKKSNPVDPLTATQMKPLKKSVLQSASVPGGLMSSTPNQQPYNRTPKLLQLQSNSTPQLIQQSDSTPQLIQQSVNKVCCFHFPFF